MADVNQLVALMRGKSDQYNELRRLVTALPLQRAFEDCRSALTQLSPDERFDLWHFARMGPQKDRLAGILCVAEGRMPSVPVFGEFNMPAGDKLTDYDLARRFLLENNPQLGTWMPDFYPEFRQLTHRKRVLAIAAAHVNCDPTGMKQVNLFALCGKLDLKEAEKSSLADGPGTTCALFMRAVLRAAGDARMTDNMLPSPANMLKAMGVHSINGPPFVNSLTAGGKDKTPRAGDLYHICIPSVILRRPGDPLRKDAGHVGFVTSDARINDGTLEFNSIDGGSTASGNKTVTNVRQYARNGRGYWEATNFPALAPYQERRILVGFVDLDQTVSSFEAQTSTSLDGRSIDVQYPG